MSLEPNGLWEFSSLGIRTSNPELWLSVSQGSGFRVMLLLPGMDYPLVAVSKEFETMTGYLRPVGD